MRRFESVWKFAGGAFTDYTAVAGRGGAAISLQGGDKLYLGQDDWLSGALVMVATPPAAPPTYLVEQWEGGAWRELQAAQAYEDQTVGFDILEQAFDFKVSGVLEWGRSPFRWAQQVPVAGAAGFPEVTGTPPDVVNPRFWVRIVFTTGGPVVLDRLLPQLYNTYATPSELASFMSLPDWDEVNSPTASEVRHFIRRHEDWLDQYTRKAWRPRMRRHETHDFNPYGVELDYQPLMFVTEAGLWNGTSFEALAVGRGRDFYVDRYLSMVFPNTPSFRLRYYSFLLSRYLRQPRSFRVSYVYGADFENDERGMTVQDIVLKRAAADLVTNGDWSKFLVSGLDVVPKPERVQFWRENAQEQADNLRSLATA